jgi:orotidine-5'-phosphate decarboxylase
MTDLLHPQTPKERLIVALDVATAEQATALAEQLGEEVLWVKVGLELFCAAGAPMVERLARMGKRIFLDLKFHDIPNTVAGAVAAVTKLPVHLVNMHAAAGEAAMRAAAEAASARADLGLLAVTRLTSQARGGVDFSDVERAAEEAAEAGLFGVVCPAQAAGRLRDRFGRRLARVVPGIRPAGANADDQVHIATPEGAIRAGADWIVVGRAITRAEDPAAAARAIQAAIAVARTPGVI